MGWKVRAGGLSCPADQPQVRRGNGLVAPSVWSSLASSGAPQGGLFHWGEGLPSYPLPPGLLPASRGTADLSVQALINCARGAEHPAMTHFLFPGARNSFLWMLGQCWGLPPQQLLKVPAAHPSPGLGTPLSLCSDGHQASPGTIKRHWFRVGGNLSIGKIRLRGMCWLFPFSFSQRGPPQATSMWSSQS